MNSPFLFTVLLYLWIDIGGHLLETNFNFHQNEFLGYFEYNKTRTRKWPQLI